MLAIVNSTIVSIYGNMEQYSKALKFYQKALEIKTESFYSATCGTEYYLQPNW